MKYLISFILVSGFVFNCVPKNKTYPEELGVEKDAVINSKDYGTLISSIKILTYPTTEQLNEVGSESILGIPIDNINKHINEVVDVDKIVVKEKKVNLVIDYPLKRPVIFELENEKGFARKDLLLAIYQKYQEIYKIEEETATVKTISMENRQGLSNRNETNGKYGIWGYDLIDLYLTDIEVYKDKNGSVNILLYVES